MQLFRPDIVTQQFPDYPQIHGNHSQIAPPLDPGSLRSVPDYIDMPAQTLMQVNERSLCLQGVQAV